MHKKYIEEFGGETSRREITWKREA